MLVHKYKLFKIESSESIVDMFIIRFIDIVNSLKSLGMDYTNSELVCKIFKLLSKNWEPR